MICQDLTGIVNYRGFWVLGGAGRTKKHANGLWALETRSFCNTQEDSKGENRFDTLWNHHVFFLIRFTFAKIYRMMAEWIQILEKNMITRVIITFLRFSASTFQHQCFNRRLVSTWVAMPFEESPKAAEQAEDPGFSRHRQTSPTHASIMNLSPQNTCFGIGFHIFFPTKFIFRHIHVDDSVLLVDSDNHFEAS